MNDTCCMLTTVDNPYNPFDDFTSWYMFDMEKGYDCCGKLMRIANISDDLTESEQNQEIEKAIDTIIKYDFMDLFQKIKKDEKSM